MGKLVGLQKRVIDIDIGLNDIFTPVSLSFHPGMLHQEGFNR